MDDPEIGRLRLNALRIRVESCFAFASIAQINYELGKDHDARRFLSDGEQEYCSLFRLFSQSGDLPLEAKEQLQSDIMELRKLLNEVRQLSKVAR